MPSRLEIFLTALKLGCTSFGGPVAHLGYFHEEYVVRRRWITEAAYADLVALCQTLPGPASSQVGFAMGLLRGGWLSGLLAWVGFTLPSAVIMILAGYGIASLGDLTHAGWLRGLQLAALAVIAQAIWKMGQSLCPDVPRKLLAIAAAVALVLNPPVAWSQIAVLVVGGLIGLLLPGGRDASTGERVDPGLAQFRVGRRAAAIAAVTFLGILLALPVLNALLHRPAVEVFGAFYRSGSFVFGGGHVILPLLRTETVATGWVDESRFLAGYGVAQAVPGPLFTFAGYLGTVMSDPRPTGVVGALLCLLGIFLPGGLLVIVALPFWEGLRKHPGAGAILRGVNAVVVGILLAALLQTLRTGVIGDWRGAVVVVAALLSLSLRCPPWLVVGSLALAGQWLLY